MQDSHNTSGDSYFKKIILSAVFFIVTPLVIFSSALSLIALSNSNQKRVASQNIDLTNVRSGVQVYASLPDSLPSISGEVVGEDARPLLIENYLKENNSPLQDYAELIVQTSDIYDLDYRLITAIAQKESGLCRVIPEDSYNCWGWGIHSQGTLKFSSFAEGIEVVSKGLKENYVDMGYVTVEEIMTKYAHPSSTTWAEGVSVYMSQIE